MSHEAIRWAWAQPIKPASAKLVLLAIADRANEENLCWPSIDRMTKDTGLDRKTIMACVSKLENIGVLTVIRENGASNKYQLLVTGSECVTSTKNGTSTEIGTSTKNGTRPVPKTVLGPVPKTGHKPVREPVKNHKDINATKKTNGNESSELKILVDAGITDDQLAMDFIKLRKAKRAPLSKSALDGILREAEKAGISISEAITICVVRGWQSFNSSWAWNTNINVKNNPANTKTKKYKDYS